LQPTATATPTVAAARPERGSDYASLSRQVKQAGLLSRRHGYYATKIAINSVLFAGGWVAFFLLGNSWYQLFVAAFLAVMFTQVAFVGHDAGHRQIFRSRRANDLVGLVHGNLMVGLSFGWWVAKHNKHHANPNHADKDPDIGVGALVYTAEQAGLRRGAARLLTRSQAYLFFPMLLLEALNLHVSSLRALWGRPARSRPAEALLLVLHVAAYLTALLLVLSPFKALAFFAVQQGLFGFYMGCSFAPNHKGMPIFSEDDDLDYLRRQVLTSRNVTGGWLVDWLLGGLNYQIEHHLFPSMPRPSLRRSQALIRAHCHQLGLPYEQVGLLRTYVEVLRHLRAVGEPLRPSRELSS
jgi:fatty acid desaturase